MPYAAMRLYAGSSSRGPEEIDKIVERELLPQLKSAGGLVRYTTLSLHDGRIGAFSAYEDKTAADRGRQIAVAWVGSTGALSGFKLADTYEGEVICTLNGDPLQAGAYGVGRIYETDASADNVRAAMEASANDIQAVPGFQRLVAVKLEGRGVGVFSTVKTQEGASQLTELAKKTRSVDDSALQKVFPRDPEQFEATVIRTYSP